MADQGTFDEAAGVRAGDGSRDRSGNRAEESGEEKSVEVEGTISAVLAGTMFRVKLPSRSRGAGPHFGQDAQALHPPGGRGQGENGDVALRRLQGADRLPAGLSRLASVEVGPPFGRHRLAGLVIRGVVDQPVRPSRACVPCGGFRSRRAAALVDGELVHFHQFEQGEEGDDDLGVVVAPAKSESNWRELRRVERIRGDARFCRRR